MKETKRWRINGWEKEGEQNKKIKLKNIFLVN